MKPKTLIDRLEKVKFELRVKTNIGCGHEEDIEALEIAINIINYISKELEEVEEWTYHIVLCFLYHSYVL